MKRAELQQDRPVERSYLLRFLGFACFAGLCSAGGVANIRRRTSSELGICLGFTVLCLSGMMQIIRQNYYKDNDPERIEES